MALENCRRKAYPEDSRSMSALITCGTVYLLLIFFFPIFSCKSVEANGSDENTDQIQKGNSVPELDDAITVIYQDQHARYWFGSKQKGLYQYSNGQLRHYSKDDGLVDNQILGIQEDSLGNLYIETIAGVSKYNGHTFNTLQVSIRDSTDNWSDAQPGDLWFRIGFDRAGPYRFDGEFLHYCAFPTSPIEDEFYDRYPEASYNPYGIYTVYKDQNGFVWFGTSGVGLCRFDGRHFGWYYEEQLQKTLSGGDFGMRTIFQDRDGHFWFNNSRFRYEVKPGSNDILQVRKKQGIGYSQDVGKGFPYFFSMIQDDEGDLWMTTYDDGVWQTSGDTLINHSITENGESMLLYSMFQDDENALWLGTQNAGIYTFNGDSFEKFIP